MTLGHEARASHSWRWALLVGAAVVAVAAIPALAPAQNDAAEIQPAAGAAPAEAAGEAGAPLRAADGALDCPRLMGPGGHFRRAGMERADGERHGRHEAYRRGHHRGFGKHGRGRMRERARLEIMKADADRNGLVSEAELVARAEACAAQRARKVFAWMDDNGDGAIAPSELAPRTVRRMGRMFDMADADGDGAVTRDELFRILGER